MSGLTFPKSARLHHRTLVNHLFEHGESLYDYPLRLVWLCSSPEQVDEMFRHGRPEGIGKVQMMVTIPKKKQRRAVDRVLLRRRIKECYRLMRPEFESLAADLPEGSHLALGFIYITPEIKSSDSIRKHMSYLLKKLSQKMNIPTQ